MDVGEIMQYLPHRYPFLMVDRVISIEPGKSIVAIKNVTINEPFFVGHFPQQPIMPGVMILEALAQASAILSFKTDNFKVNDDSVYYFVGIDNARFKKPVVVGDQLFLHATLTRHIKGFWKFTAQAKVSDEVVAEAELICAVRAK
ncbi:MAG TPA: 3-hydroxyacyl-ACP dehydratase FabZ [Burkholderiales bacterium]|nr:3-hydroxyacyl-ACP dehydratase FabZ [Burkholderiales bacterium]HYA19869.1 3-hydroxyacyl-ACP dehydratase FabZ [Burkholderiales bacterium]